jgi:hypothetical protein
MRCLFDKVTARYTLQGLLKLAEGQDVNDEELFTLDLFERAGPDRVDLFIAPSTANILQQIAELPRYADLVQLFLTQVNIAFSTRYFSRWTRRLRDYAFTREDAAILALASFGTNEPGTILGMDILVTYDQPMMRHWKGQYARIEERFFAMTSALPPPYNQAVLPKLLRSEQV